MKLQSFINGMIVGIVIGALVPIKKGEAGKKFVRRVSGLRDKLTAAHDSAEEEVLEKLSELTNEEEEKMNKMIHS